MGALARRQWEDLYLFPPAALSHSALGLSSGYAQPLLQAEPRTEPGQRCFLQAPRYLHPFLGYQAPKMPGRGCGCCPIPFLLQSAVQRHKVVLQPLTPAPMEAPRTLPGQTLEARETPALKNWPKIEFFCSTYGDHPRADV